MGKMWDNVWNNENKTQTDPFKILSQSPKDKERLYERTEKPNPPLDCPTWQNKALPRGRDS